jgi:hypothetical protein
MYTVIDCIYFFFSFKILFFPFLMNVTGKLHPRVTIVRLFRLLNFDVCCLVINVIEVQKGVSCSHHKLTPCILLCVFKEQNSVKEILSFFQHIDNCKTIFYWLNNFGWSFCQSQQTKKANWSTVVTLLCGSMEHWSLFFS